MEKNVDDNDDAADSDDVDGELVDDEDDNDEEEDSCEEKDMEMNKTLHQALLLVCQLQFKLKTMVN